MSKPINKAKEEKLYKIARDCYDFRKNTLKISQAEFAKRHKLKLSAVSCFESGYNDSAIIYHAYIEELTDYMGGLL